jgi:hypothetical protein
VVTPSAGEIWKLGMQFRSQPPLPTSPQRYLLRQKSYPRHCFRPPIRIKNRLKLKARSSTEGSNNGKDVTPNLPDSLPAIYLL